MRGAVRAGAARLRRALRRKLFLRRLSFTREGRVYVIVTLGVGIAAVNTGNNLLFLVLGLMLGLILTSGVLSEISLRRVEIRRRAPRRVEAGTVFPVELGLRNLKRRASSFSVELRDEIDGEPFRRRCFFLRVAAGDTRSIAYRCELLRRGPARFDGVHVSTRFPFGLFEKSRFVPLVDDVIAQPARIRVGVPDASVVAGEGPGGADLRGPGQDFRELREMVPGDDSRRIDWRGTARLGRPLVRETERDSRGLVEIVLDAAPSGKGDALERCERDISAAGTLVRELIREGAEVRLVTSPLEALVGSGSGGGRLLLDHLALLDVERARDSDPPLGRHGGAVLIGPRAATRGRGHRLPVPRPEAAGAAEGRS
ncbi:MAG: DUF58 domain-containing protein [Polyangia bacterium]